MFSLAVVALTGLVIAAVGLTQPNVQKVALGLGLPVSYVAAARKWATWYRVPFEWVLATILVESGGKPNVRGDADGRSVGLMQVNVVANAKDVTLAQMLDPEQNIKWGTKYLKDFTDKVEEALGGRTPPVPPSWIVRLYYKGPKTVLGVLNRGGNPATTISWAPEALRRWAAAMAKVTALTGKQTS
jgi:soluble lytic murein transglycosylase-like protein